MIEILIPVVLVVACGVYGGVSFERHRAQKAAGRAAAQGQREQEKRIRHIEVVAGQWMKPTMDASVVENTGPRFAGLEKRMAKLELKLEDHFGRAVGDRILAGKDRARIIELEEQRMKEGHVLRQLLTNQVTLLERLVEFWEPKKGAGA